MKNYFPHDSDARSDDKIIALRIKHKWEGYGLYWALIEKLRDSKDYALKADYNVLAFDLRADAAILKSVINDFGLFAFTPGGECFYSESLNTRMKPLDERKAKLSESGKRGNKKRWGCEGGTFAPQSPPDRPPIAQPSQEEIRGEENRPEEGSIPPSPPKGGGHEEQKELPQINKRARTLFEQHFMSTFSDSYYWTAKDAGSMSKLLQKLTFSRTKKQLPVDDDSVLYALEAFLSSIREGWVFENFSVTNINSKFNEIVSSARNGRDQNNRGSDCGNKPQSAGIKSLNF